MTRRRLGAFAAIYGSMALGIAAALVVLRVLGPTGAGRYSIVIGAVDFLASLVSLTSNDALVKYGFRYIAAEEWGRFHRLVRVTFACEVAASLFASALVVALAPFAGSLFHGTGGLLVPLLIAALIPPLQAFEWIAAAALLLRGRYDLRGLWLALSMALRLAGIATGAHWGVTGVVVGVVCAQFVTTASIMVLGIAGLRRFPRAAQVPLGDDRGPLMRFVLQSAGYTGLISIRTWIAPLTLGIVRNATDVGLFRGALAPQTGFAALSSPLRLILLTEQTRDWEHGRPDVVLAGIRRYTIGAVLFVAVALGPALWVMPWAVREVLGSDYLPAVDAARFILSAAAIQLIFSWSKSFPVTIGRPGLRLIAHGVETVVLLPLIVILGERFGVTGAGSAVFISSVVFAIAWVAIFVRLSREGLGATALLGGGAEHDARVEVDLAPDEPAADPRP